MRVAFVYLATGRNLFPVGLCCYQIAKGGHLWINHTTNSPLSCVRWVISSTLGFDDIQEALICDWQACGIMLQDSQIKKHALQLGVYLSLDSSQECWKCGDFNLNGHCDSELIPAYLLLRETALFHTQMRFSWMWNAKHSVTVLLFQNCGFMCEFIHIHKIHSPRSQRL